VPQQKGEHVAMRGNDDTPTRMSGEQALMGCNDPPLRSRVGFPTGVSEIEVFPSRAHRRLEVVKRLASESSFAEVSDLANG
jgi:hypothetical protein